MNSTRRGFLGTLLAAPALGWPWKKAPRAIEYVRVREVWAKDRTWKQIGDGPWEETTPYQTDYLYDAWATVRDRAK